MIPINIVIPWNNESSFSNFVSNYFLKWSDKFQPEIHVLIFKSFVRNISSYENKIRAESLRLSLLHMRHYIIEHFHHSIIVFADMEVREV